MKKSTLATWEDESNNRQIQFSVEFVIENGAIEIKTITPEKVSFVCAETNTCYRTVAVWTESGRSLLANAFYESGALDQLRNAIASPNADTIIPQMNVRQVINA